MLIGIFSLNDIGDRQVGPTGKAASNTVDADGWHMGPNTGSYMVAVDCREVTY